ncbi:MAG: hypothetical protein C5B49_08045 [Bdellovibrio sp.]|nr:MAG: hypothetical protein C5B49_08045 [Bdellovibrio sp.]
MVDMDNYFVNPLLSIRPGEPGQFILETRPYETPLATKSRLVIDGLAQLPSQFTRKQAFESWTEFDDEERKVLWNFLEEENLVMDQDQYACTLELFGGNISTASWKEAIGYHLATRDYPFLDMGIKNAAIVDNEIMKRYECERQTPDVYQDFSTGKGLQLRYIEDILNAEEAIEKSLGVQALTLILDVAFGERGKYERTYHEDINYLEMAKLLKAVPSGGGRHPAEGFVLARSVSGLADGLYHYSVRIHALERLDDGRELASLLTTAQSGPQLFILIAPVLERAMWRYREPRSWRAVAVDMGHVIGATIGMASFCGLRARAITNYDSVGCAKAINISFEEQPVLAVVQICEEEL